MSKSDSLALAAGAICIAGVILLSQFSTPSAADSVLKGMLTIFGIALVYFLPAIAAKSRRHRSQAAILLLNLFAGWTILGWFASLIWAFTGNVEPLPAGQYISQRDL